MIRILITDETAIQVAQRRELPQKLETAEQLLSRIKSSGSTEGRPRFEFYRSEFVPKIGRSRGCRQ